MPIIINKNKYQEITVEELKMLQSYGVASHKAYDEDTYIINSWARVDSAIGVKHGKKESQKDN